MRIAPLLVLLTAALAVSGAAAQTNKPVQGYALETDDILVLANAYLTGSGGTADPAKGIALLKKAAASGSTAAMKMLGRSYDNAIGVAEDNDAAIAFYQQSADAGDPEGLVYLGLMHEYGDGVAQSDAAAVRYYRLAVAEESAFGMRQLGLMYRHGRGVPKDHVEAVRLFRQAADLGDGPAMRFLAEQYYHGKGVEMHIPSWGNWLIRAAATGDPDARGELAGLMYEGNYRGKTKADARAEFEALASDPYWAAVLGNMLLSGDEEFGSDPERGIALIKWAAEAGSGRAMTYLALCYFEGKGIGRNVKAGAAWLEKAVATGHRSGYAISAVTSLNGMMPSLGPELTAEHAYLGILMGALEFETVQKLGDRAFFRALQQQLQDGGYYDGPIDGLVGPATIKAALMAQGDDMTEL